MGVPRTAYALYECRGEDVSELSFKKGDIIENITETEDEGWFCGTVSGKTTKGLFPGNYVEFISDTSKLGVAKKMDAPVASKTPAATAMPSSTSKKMSAAEMRANMMKKSGNLAAVAREKTVAETGPSPPVASPTPVAGAPTEKFPGLDKSKQPLAALMNQSSFPASGKAGHSPSSSVVNLAKNFSETSLKSDESLFSEQGPMKNPKVSKRPPLLVSNQAYDTVVQPTASEISKSVSGPPPRPLKPSELRGTKAGASDSWKSNSSTEGVKRSQTADNFWKQKDAASPVGGPGPIPQKPYVSSRPAGTMPATRSSTNPNIQSRPPNESIRPESTMSVLTDGTPFRPSNPKTLDPSLLSSDLIRRYKALFTESDLDRDGQLNGEQVRAVWQRSGLDNRSLGLIWTLSDLNDDGLLDSREFCIGMFVIDERLRGIPIPNEIPRELIDRI